MDIKQERSLIFPYFINSLTLKNILEAVKVADVQNAENKTNDLLSVLRWFGGR